MYMISCI